MRTHEDTAVYQRVDNDFESSPIVPIKTSNRSLQDIPETQYRTMYYIYEGKT